VSESGSTPLVAVAAGLLLFVAGLVSGVWTFEQWRSDHERLLAAGRADGTVTGHLNGHPVVSFALANGDRITFTARDVGGDGYREGKRVDVLYRNDQPADAVIDRPHARWARIALLGALSLAIMAFGAYMSWYARNADMRRE
jgi:hypothetical protein